MKIATQSPVPLLSACQRCPGLLQGSLSSVIKSVSLDSRLSQGLSRTTVPRGALRGHLLQHASVSEKSKARMENVFLPQYKVHHLDRNLQSSLWKAGGRVAHTLQEKLLWLTHDGYQSSRKVGFNLNHPEESSVS